MELLGIFICFAIFPPSGCRKCITIVLYTGLYLCTFTVRDMSLVGLLRKVCMMLVVWEFIDYANKLIFRYNN